MCFSLRRGRAKEKNMDGPSIITQRGHKRFRDSPGQTSGTWEDLYRALLRAHTKRDRIKGVSFFAFFFNFVFQFFLFLLSFNFLGWIASYGGGGGGFALPGGRVWIAWDSSTT